MQPMSMQLCIEELVGGFVENICFEKIGCLNGLTVRHWCKEAVTNQSSALGMH